MVEFQRYKLSNGLTVILHQDTTTPMVVVNTLYDVGARDESEQKTGFAHLFEHLMFGGSINILDFDKELQKADVHQSRLPARVVAPLPGGISHLPWRRAHISNPENPPRSGLF